jgi:hypothetical protein
MRHLWTDLYCRAASGSQKGNSQGCEPLKVHAFKNSVASKHDSKTSEPVGILQRFRHQWTVLVRGRSRRVGKSNQGPWRIVFLANRSVGIVVDYPQYFSAESSPNDEVVTLDRNHPVLLFEN